MVVEFVVTRGSLPEVVMDLMDEGSQVNLRLFSTAKLDRVY